jgi:uracil-DNA glycosylase
LVYFVGLSAKPDCEHLAPGTRTGSIIERIIVHLPFIRAVRTNLVKTPPIDHQGKLRYPNPVEMQSGWAELQEEMRRTSPSLLVTLGRQASFFLRSQVGVQPAKPELPSDFSYESCVSQAQFSILSIHHPSFVYVYRRRDIESYVDNVVASIRILVSDLPPKNGASGNVGSCLA